LNQATPLQQSILYVPQAPVAAGVVKFRATFQYPNEGLDAAGAPIDGYAPVTTLENLLCMSASPSSARIQATEVRALQEITASELHHVWFPGYYRLMDEGWRGENPDFPGQWTVLIGDDNNGVIANGFQYQILGVEFDSQSGQTRVQVKLATV
jgi:hypothetical protein